MDGADGGPAGDAVRSIEEGREPSINGLEARRSIAVIEVLYASAKAGGKRIEMQRDRVGLDAHGVGMRRGDEHARLVARVDGEVQALLGVREAQAYLGEQSWYILLD